MKFKNMGQDERKDWIETFIGGACGIGAIIAAIVEYVLGDSGAVAGMLKDVLGTAVVVILLIMAMPKRKPKNLEQILEEKVEAWGVSNAPMIFKTEGYICAKESKYTQGFVLLQNPSAYLKLLDIKKDSEEWHSYASYTSKRTGKFLDFPSYKEMVSDKFDIIFVLEQKHFKDKENIKEIIVDMTEAIEKHFDKEIADEKIKVKQVGTSEKFTIEFKSKINNKKDIEFLISVVDYVLSLVKIIA